MVARSELLAEAERLFKVYEETGRLEDQVAWREAEEKLVQADQSR